VTGLCEDSLEPGALHLVPTVCIVGGHDGQDAGSYAAAGATGAAAAEPRRKLD